MRLLSAIHGPVYGGGHAQLIRLRAPLEARGVETVALVPDEPGNALPRLEEAGVDVVSMPLHRLRATPDPRVQLPFAASLPREVSAIRRVIRERGIDVVQAHGDTNPHVAIAARREGVAVVWQLYDTRTPMALRRLTMPFVVRMADAITTWGRELAVRHPGAVGLGERCITVFPPVDAADFERAAEHRAAARRELGVPDGALVVGTVGNRNPSKGHEWLVRALEIARRERPEAVGRVLGAASPPHADWERAVRAEAAERGLPMPQAFDLVDPGRRVPELIGAFDVFALSSVPRSEGVPTVILEAMAAGVPVVATDVGAVSELVEDGVTGLVVPPLDAEALGGAILTLARDAALRASFAETARERARERFGLERLADIHLHAYRTAVAHRAGRRGSRARAPLASGA